ncbi:hypothetical protein JRO89_XS13G0124500 [Xanthoceras sorbifolium]|uniref:Cyclin-dependent protein kinase inhibitor SMR3 n=1 Tax=Xanthoceras sorbifolium TaxID=99658 RepID=A0ABQ8H810_9ROSI|nr:hypothetical protein JRO89_XS13G0124500 [Xanthoceras sorbifolium]
MGVSNSEMFLSEKDLNALELNFLARSTLEFEEEHHECQIAPLQEDDVFVKREQEEEEKKKIEKEEKQEDKCRILVSSLKIKLPNILGEFKDEEDNNDGFKTPTSSDHKMPPVLQCPPAPRKPKSRPLITKRKLPAAAQRRVLHDLSNEIEALFPPVLLADLGNKIKKVREEK